MKTLIIGSGAVGSLVGGYLARGGRDVTIADGWWDHVRAVNDKGLTIESVEGDLHVGLRAIHLDALEREGPADLIVIASKSYDTRMMSLLAREHMHQDTWVMSAQNGMNDAAVADIVGARRTMGCVVVFGADLLDAGRVRRSSAMTVPPLVLGHLAPGRDFEEVLKVRSHLEPVGAVRAVEDIWPERWGKLTLNSMSNAVAGLTGLRSNALWTEGLTLDILIALGHETALVAQAAGISAAPVLERIPHQMLVDATSRSGSAWRAVAEHMRQVAAGRVGRKKNRASLLQDIENHRRTEIDHINGWVVREGRRRGVGTPTHEQIMTALAPVERGERRPALENAAELARFVRQTYGT